MQASPVGVLSGIGRLRAEGASDLSPSSGEHDFFRPLEFDRSLLAELSPEIRGPDASGSGGWCGVSMVQKGD